MDRGTKNKFGLSNISGTVKDTGLVSAAQAGDLEAFEKLVRRHQTKIFNLALRMTGRYEDAGDVTQEVFISAFRHLRTFRGKSKFSTWLTSIAVNLSRNRLAQINRRAAQETVSLDDPLQTEDGAVPREVVSNEPSAQERLESKNAQQAVQDCINRLPTKFREVLVLRDLQELAYDEISDLLKLQEGTVKSRLFRARVAVKLCLKRVIGEL